MQVGIVGAGLIGNKRAKNLCGCKLVKVADVNENNAKKLADEHGCEYTTDWKEVVSDKSIDIVIVATPHNYLAPIAIEAIKNGKHVLVEKPGARNPEELKEMINAAKNAGVKVKVGYNHRFHPSVLKAKEIVEGGEIGEVMFIRGRYGHGGRLGYEKEWRAKKDMGGGEALDQASHLIDLSRWFIDGNFSTDIGFCDTFFWNMEVEDNCFALLRNEKGQVAFLHASWTEWKNLFSFEVFCKTGLVKIDGLGGSYGTETLTFYKMKPEMGIPDKEVFEYAEEDKSWELEFKELLTAIEENREPMSNLEDSYENIKTVFDIYKWSKEHKEG